MNRSEDFLRSMQNHVARAAFPPSAMRGKGNIGVGEVARTFCRTLQVRPFGTTDPSAFAEAHDRGTEDLRLAFNASAQHRWGLARKLLNIFLRDALYNRYLSDAFGLASAEHLFELPLDSYTASALRKQAGREAFVRWPGVIHLTPDLNAQMQRAAEHHAKQLGTYRVHLDTLWWGR